MSILKVRLETVNYGNWENLTVAIDCANPQSGLHVTYPTVETILNYRADSVREKLASKSFKSFVGAAKDIGKFSAVIVNKPAGSMGTPKVNVLHFDDFLLLARWEAIVNKNEEIINLLVLGFGDSFRSLALEQLGVKATVDERLNWWKVRYESKALFWELTDSIKQYHLSRGVEPKFYHYSNAMDAINRGLFGKTAKEIRAELGVTEGLTRDNFGDKALRWLTTVQETAARYVNEGKEPQQAVTEVLTLLRYERIPYNV